MAHLCDPTFKKALLVCTRLFQMATRFLAKRGLPLGTDQMEVQAIHASSVKLGLETSLGQERR